MCKRYDEIPFMTSTIRGFDQGLNQTILDMFSTKPTTWQTTNYFESKYSADEEDATYLYFSMHDTRNVHVHEVMREKHCEMVPIDDVQLSPQSELWIKEFEDHGCFEAWDIQFPK